MPVNEKSGSVSSSGYERGSTEDPSMRTVLNSPTTSTSMRSPTFQGRSSSRRVLRLKCPICNEYPDGFRSEHELRRHTNRVHKKIRTVWVTVDTSPDKSFLANCKACQTGKRYNECYNAASHLRRMHFHPHKRGERRMSDTDVNGRLDPPMEVLKANWLREVQEVVGEDEDEQLESEKIQPNPPRHLPHPQAYPGPIKRDGKAPVTPTTPSTRMAIDSLVD
ncbi:uncharacterized protein EI97DRAFT_443639 [Westerdykella ornata]|uniref:DUF7896 domain-containing protein n=1 Tax=Westerdykella ornata TaxID=318751 RepID=A0A6A6JF92_WESOR|nr:uncharacterized protein EI97DRAFT_443639 [Westerdykella ornata]KAF2275082.1 hypothetical protein EI97DRAFT_443639 [Westerdykella ornata]